MQNFRIGGAAAASFFCSLQLLLLLLLRSMCVHKLNALAHSHSPAPFLSLSLSSPVSLSIVSFGELFLFLTARSARSGSEVVGQKALTRTTTMQQLLRRWQCFLYVFVVVVIAAVAAVVLCFIPFAA